MHELPSHLSFFHRLAGMASPIRPSGEGGSSNTAESPIASDRRASFPVFPEPDPAGQEELRHDYWFQMGGIDIDTQVVRGGLRYRET